MTLDREPLLGGYKLNIFADNTEGFVALQALADQYNMVIQQETPSGRAVDVESLALEPYNEGSVILRKRDGDTGFVTDEGPIIQTPVSLEVAAAEVALAALAVGNENNLAVIKRIK